MKTEKWLELRKQGIGGTDISAICGLNKWKTPLDVYNDKLGIADNFAENGFTRRGLFMEDSIANYFKESTGFTVEKPKHQVNKHPKERHHLASIDRIYTTQDGTKGILDCKTTISKIETIDDKPEYNMQLQWYMYVKGYSEAYLCICYDNPFDDFYLYNLKVERNDDLIQQMVVSANIFWHENILAQIPPEPVNSSELLAYYKELNKDYVDGDLNDLKDYNQLNDINLKIKELNKSKNEISERLKMRILGCEGLIYNSEKLATYKVQERHTINSKSLKLEQPEIYNKYLTTTKSRVFRLSK